ncbi:MAG: iron chelate uptake ABC transporter family permease subunit [Chloroflexi bacterium]|nr:iron chelate uptake ABC transporter family permease subunit [Chloroflexota bacterium]
MIERLIVDFLLQFLSVDQLNDFLSDPRTVAILVGMLIAVSTGLLGTFLLLRKMSMTSDAISHTILLGLVVVILLMIYVFDVVPDLSSPWLIVGAAIAGVLTVISSELINRSGLVKEDAALGMTYSVMFGIAIILISGFLTAVHFDNQQIIMGEIGLAWADTNNYCISRCDDVVITPDDSRAKTGRQCINCTPPGVDGIKPRDPEAEFETYCVNCGTYSASKAWGERLIEAPPTQVFWPKSLTVMAFITLINASFVMLFYKELKLSTFDAGLAATLGFRPQWLKYGLMILVSLTAVGAFEAVGAILVVAFFIIPSAAAYLLTERLSHTLLLSPFIGGLSVYTGYELARGNFLWLVDIGWDTSISASIVLMAAFYFGLAWLLSPRRGLTSSVFRHWQNRRRFAEYVLMGHLKERDILTVEVLSHRLNWSEQRTQRILQRLQTRRLVTDHLQLTPRGQEALARFSHWRTPMQPSAAIPDASDVMSG